VGDGGRDEDLRLGGLSKPPERQEGLLATTPLSNCGPVGGMQTWGFLPARATGRGEVIARHQGLKPYWGQPTVRNFRGGAGNVRDGRTRTPLHLSKEWRAETLGLRLRAPVPYSTVKAEFLQGLMILSPERLQEHLDIITACSLSLLM
jgi:hypothetical protein